MDWPKIHPFETTVPGKRLSADKRVLASFILLLLAWFLFFLLMPPLRTPDETGHYAYVQSLASGHYPHLPGLEELKVRDVFLIQESPLGREVEDAYHVREYTPLGGWVFNNETREINPGLSDETSISVQAYEPPLYYGVATTFYLAAKAVRLSPIGIYFATRLASLLFYIVFVGSCWWLTRNILEARVADFLTLAIALQPTLLMETASVNPEIGAIALFTLTFSFLVVGLRAKGVGLSFPVLLGLLSAAAVLSKFTAIIIVPAAVLGLGLLLKAPWTRRWKLLALYGLTTLALLTPWFIFNHLHHGSVLPNNADVFKQIEIREAGGAVVEKGRSLGEQVVWALVDFRHSLFSLVGYQGWPDVLLLLPLRVLYSSFIFIFLLAGLLLLIRQGRKSASDQAGVLSAAALALLALFLLAYSFRLRADNDLDLVLQARYFLIGLLPAAILLFSGLEYVLRPWRAVNAVSIARGLFFGSLVFFLLNLLYTMIPRSYV